MTKKSLRNRLIKMSMIGILFLYIFAPSPEFLPVSIKIIFITFFIFYGAVEYRKLITLIALPRVCGFLFIIIALISYGFFVMSFIGFDVSIKILDQYPIQFLYSFVIQFLIVSSGIALLWTKKKLTIDDLLDSYVTIALIQSVIATVMILFPAFRTIVLKSFLGLSAISIGIEDKYFIFRVFGIAASGYYMSSMPLFQGLAIGIILCDFSLGNKKSIVYLPILLVSILFNARIGLISIPISLLVIFFFNIYYFRYGKLLTIFFGLILIGGSTIAAFILISSQIVDTKNIELTLKWITAGFNFENFGHIQTLTKLHTHFPETIGTWIFGEGRYIHANLNETFSSDIGYINYLFFGGIIFSILLYVSFLYFLFKGYKKMSTRMKMITMVSALMLFISNYKGRVFSGNAFTAALLLLFLVNDLSDRHARAGS